MNYSYLILKLQFTCKTGILSNIESINQNFVDRILKLNDHRYLTYNITYYLFDMSDILMIINLIIGYCTVFIYIG